MSGQSNAAAERSAHVTRGDAGKLGHDFLTEIAPGVFRLKAVVRAEAERDAAIADRDKAPHAYRMRQVALEQASAASEAEDSYAALRDEYDRLMIERDLFRNALHRLVSTLWVDGPDADRIINLDAFHAARTVLAGEGRTDG